MGALGGLLGGLRGSSRSRRKAEGLYFIPTAPRKEGADICVSSGFLGSSGEFCCPYPSVSSKSPRSSPLTPRLRRDEEDPGVPCHPLRASRDESFIIETIDATAAAPEELLGGGWLMRGRPHGQQTGPERLPVADN